MQSTVDSLNAINISKKVNTIFEPIGSVLHPQWSFNSSKVSFWNSHVCCNRDGVTMHKRLPSMWSSIVTLKTVFWMLAILYHCQNHTATLFWVCKMCFRSWFSMTLTLKTHYTVLQCLVRMCEKKKMEWLQKVHSALFIIKAGRYWNVIIY